MDGGRIGGGVFRSLLEPRARSLVHARGAPLMCRLHRVLANSRAADRAGFCFSSLAKIFFLLLLLPFSPSSSPFLYPIAPTSPLFFRSSLFFSPFLLVLAFSVVISPSGLRSWLVINESRKNRRTEGGSVERRWP